MSITSVKHMIAGKFRPGEKRSFHFFRRIKGSGSADLSFIKKASAFLVAQHIASEEHIDYMQLVTDLDNAIIKVSLEIAFLYFSHSLSRSPALSTDWFSMLSDSPN